MLARWNLAQRSHDAEAKNWSGSSSPIRRFRQNFRSRSAPIWIPVSAIFLDYKLPNLPISAAQVLENTRSRRTHNPKTCEPNSAPQSTKSADCSNSKEGANSYWLPLAAPVITATDKNLGPIRVHSLPKTIEQRTTRRSTNLSGTTS